jgi:hypothetical protein
MQVPCIVIKIITAMLQNFSLFITKFSLLGGLSLICHFQPLNFAALK